MSQGELSPVSRITFKVSRIVGALHRVSRTSAPQGLTEIVVQLDAGHATNDLARHLNGLHSHIVSSGLWGPRAGEPIPAPQSMRYETVEPGLLPADVPCIALEREGGLVFVVSRLAMSQALADELNEHLAQLVGESGDWIQHWGGAVCAMAS